MKSDTSYFLIGLFVIVGTMLLVAGTIALSAGDAGESDIKAYTLVTESVSGLEPGAPVRFRGVEVGKVESTAIAMSIYETRKPYIVVHFSIKPARKDRTVEEIRQVLLGEIERGLRLRLASAGITGQLYLEWDIMKDADEKYPPYERDWIKAGEEEERLYVPSAASTMKGLVSSLEKTLDNLADADLAGLIEEAKGTLKTTSAKLDEIDAKAINDKVIALMDTATEAVQSIDREIKELLDEATSLVADPELKSKVKSILANIDSSTMKLDEILADPNVSKAIANIEKLTGEARDAIASIQGAVGPAKKLLADARNAIKSKDRDLDAIVKNIAALTHHLENLSRTLESYPSFALFGNPPEKKGPRK